MSALCTWFFEDKRATTCLMLAWMVVTCVIFWFLGAFHIKFMTFGPSNGTMFMGMTIDTWPKWSALAGFSFWNTAMNEFLGSALGPWFVNTIQVLPRCHAQRLLCTRG